jgi:hypothetical protein
MACFTDKMNHIVRRPDPHLLLRGTDQHLFKAAAIRSPDHPTKIERATAMRNTSPSVLRFATALALTAAACTAGAHDGHTGGIKTQPSAKVQPAFDIFHTKITTKGNMATFHVAVSGKAGASKPQRSGKVAGSTVFSYVWPTSLDPSTAGFEPKSGTLAFAVTSHPDFDDTPLFDENGDGNPANDGSVWHSHWVVLQPDDACGKGNLKVVDIPEGAKPRLPKTWAGFPILLDSPGWHPKFAGKTLDVNVPFDDIGALEGPPSTASPQCCESMQASMHHCYAFPM